MPNQLDQLCGLRALNVNSDSSDDEVETSFHQNTQSSPVKKFQIDGSSSSDASEKENKETRRSKPRKKTTTTKKSKKRPRTPSPPARTPPVSESEEEEEEEMPAPKKSKFNKKQDTFKKYITSNTLTVCRSKISVFHLVKFYVKNLYYTLKQRTESHTHTRSTFFYKTYDEVYKMLCLN